MTGGIGKADGGLTTLARGIYHDLYHEHREYYGITSDGRRLPGVRVPIGAEIEVDVICIVWEELNRVDPIEHPEAARHLRLVTTDASAEPAAATPRRRRRPVLRLER